MDTVKGIVLGTENAEWLIAFLPKHHALIEIQIDEIVPIIR